MSDVQPSDYSLNVSVDDIENVCPYYEPPWLISRQSCANGQFNQSKKKSKNRKSKVKRQILQDVTNTSLSDSENHILKQNERSRSSFKPIVPKQRTKIRNEIRDHVLNKVDIANGITRPVNRNFWGQLPGGGVRSSRNLKKMQNQGAEILFDGYAPVFSTMSEIRQIANKTIVNVSNYADPPARLDYDFPRQRIQIKKEILHEVNIVQAKIREQIISRFQSSSKHPVNYCQISLKAD